MKSTYLIIILFLLLGMGASSCITTHNRGRKARHGNTLPPGQVKKITGSQSARDYAPGHNK